MDAPPNSLSRANLRVLRDLNTDDLLQAAALTGLARHWPSFRRLTDGPSLVLARQLAAFDAAVGRGAAREASQQLLAVLGTRALATGAPLVTTGPRLFLANHPGLGDFLALMTVLASPELKVVARDRPFLRALPALADRLFLIPERNAVGVLRRVQTHLAAGGAVLTFPAGGIEPDPAWTAPTGWSAWSASTALWARTVPGLAIQPLLVAGVRHRGFVDPWWARWRRPEHRDWTAAVLQLIGQVLFQRPRLGPITVAVGPALADPAGLPPVLNALALSVRRPTAGT